jgi:streptomycin 6-kinase
VTEGPDREPARPASAALSGLQRLSGSVFAPGLTAAGQGWVASLPSLVVKIADTWRLVVDTEDIRHGYNAVVLPAEQAGRPVALKLVWPQRRVGPEAEALAAWRGNGVVALMRVDRGDGALLLERLDAANPLSRLPLAEAAQIAGGLIRTLAVDPPRVRPLAPADTTTPAFPATRDEARRLVVSLRRRQRALGHPVRPDWLRVAISLATTLSASPGACLVHADLHYDNVLASYRSGRQWVAVDPKAMIGDPERSVPELLWTRADELDDADAIMVLLGQIVEGGHLDQDMAMAWALVRTIDYWLWGLQHGLTEDPVRCERLARALVARCGKVSAAGG